MFQELQNWLVAYVGGIPLLAAALDGKIIARSESNLTDLVIEDVTTGIGLSVVVLYPFPTQIHPNLPGLSCEKIMVTLRVCEEVASNASGVSALQCAEFIHRALHLVGPGTDGLGKGLLVALVQNPWRDPATIPGRNEIELNFTIQGAVGPLFTYALSGPADANYRFQNALTFQLFDADTEEFTTIWAATVNGAVLPLLADADDAMEFTGATFAPRLAANARVNDAGNLQLLNPGTGAWHLLFVHFVGGVKSVAVDQTPDSSTLTATGNLPRTGNNYYISEADELFLLGDDGVYYPPFVQAANGIKTLRLGDAGVNPDA